MITALDFHVSKVAFGFKKDDYPLARIRNARVKKNTLMDHLVRVLCIGLLVSSIVWIICPPAFGYWSGPLAISIGLAIGLLTTRKYELQVEFQHDDETGLQWISIAKANKKEVKLLFEQQVDTILQQVNSKTR